MSIRIVLLACLSGVGIGAISLAHAGESSYNTSGTSNTTNGGKNHTMTVTATFATEGMFRGITQTQHDPAVEAEFEYAHTNGVFAGIWGSNVDFSDPGPDDDEADLELNFYLGYGASLNDDWTADITVIRKIFPDTAPGFDLDWNELDVGVHYREYVSFLVAYSNKVFNLDGRGIYYGLSGTYPLRGNYTLVDGLRLTASVGYYDLDDALDDSYVDWSLGVEADRGIFTARLAYVDSDGSADDLFGDGQADARLVFSITAEFGQ